MKKILSFLLLCLTGMVAWAQSPVTNVNATFSNTGTSWSGVNITVAATDASNAAVSGITATVTGNTAPKTVSQPGTNCIVINKNSNAMSNEPLNFTISGLPAGSKFNRINLPMYAITGSGTFQQSAGQSDVTFKVTVIEGSNTLYENTITNFNVPQIQKGELNDLLVYECTEDIVTNGGDLQVNFSISKGSVNNGMCMAFQSLKLSYLSEVEYTVNVSGAAGGGVVFDGQQYSNEEKFTATGLTVEQLTAVPVAGYDVDIAIDGTNINVTYSVHVAAFPDAGTHYVKLTNKDSANRPYIHNALAESTYTLQSEAPGTTNDYIWKVVSDGAGNITSIVNGDGRGVGTNGQYQGRVTSLQYKDKGDGYYYLTSSVIKAAKNDHECLNRSNGGYNTSNGWTVTTWVGENNADNQWKVETVDVSALNVYNVVVAGAEGYVTYSTTNEYAYNGGFFLATGTINETDLEAAAITGYNGSVSVSGNTITVEYTVLTTEYTVHVTGATGGVTYEGTTYNDGDKFTATGLTETDLVITPVEGYTVSLEIDGTDINVTYESTAPTVVAQMAELVAAASHNDATQEIGYNVVTDGAVYSFDGTNYIGGISNDALAKLFNDGQKTVTVAAWIYGNPTGGAIFGYGGQSNGIKVTDVSGTLQTTLKGKIDQISASATLTANQWNLVAFSVKPNGNTRYIVGTSGSNYFTRTDESSTMSIPAATEQLFAIGSGNQEKVREGFKGMIANLTIIKSGDYLDNATVSSLVGAAPTPKAIEYTVHISGTTSDAKVTYGANSYADGETFEATALQESELSATEVAGLDYSIAISGTYVNVTYVPALIDVTKTYYILSADAPTNMYVYMGSSTGNVALSTTDKTEIQFEKISTGVYAIKGDDKYIGINTWNAVPATSSFGWTVAKAEGDIFTFSQNTGSYTGFLGTDAAKLLETEAKLYNNKGATDPHSFILVEVGTANWAGLEAAINSAYKYPVGDGLGEFSWMVMDVAQNDLWEPTLEYYSDILSEKTATADEVDEYIGYVQDMIAALQINQPKPGTFLRVIGANSLNSIAGDNSVSNGHAAMTDAYDATSILCYTEDGELIGYKSGLGFTGTYSRASVGGTFEHHTFSASPYGEKGTYTIQSDFSGSKVLYDGGTDVNRNSAANSVNCAWYLEEITELPVEFKEAGKDENDKYYSTLYSPVAVELHPDVTAYYATSDESSFLSVEPLESDVVPANTPVILEADEAGTKAFLLASENEDDPLTGNLLHGTVYTKESTSSQDYVLSIVDGKVGFYKYVGSSLQGFKAYFNPTENGSASSEIQGFTLDFGGQTVGVNSVISATNLKAGYDIQGRRINKVQKGINILNGKKIIK